MRKYIISILVILVIQTTGSFSQNALDGHLYRISAKHLKQDSYLFAVLPGYAQANSLSTQLKSTIDECDVVVLEFLLDEESVADMTEVQKMEKKNLQKLLGKKKFTEVDLICTDILGQDLVFYNQEYPLVVRERIIDKFLDGFGRGIEKMIYDYAGTKGKELAELQNARNYKRRYYSIDLKEQAGYFYTDIKRLDELKDLLNKTRKNYYYFNYDKIFDDWKAFEPADVFKQMITNVQSRITRSIESLLFEKSNFIVVDVKYFGGSTGILAKLKDGGYEVQPVYRDDIELPEFEEVVEEIEEVEEPVEEEIVEEPEEEVEEEIEEQPEEEVEEETEEQPEEEVEVETPTEEAIAIPESVYRAKSAVIATVMEKWVESIPEPQVEEVEELVEEEIEEQPEEEVEEEIEEQPEEEVVEEPEEEIEVEIPTEEEEVIEPVDNDTMPKIKPGIDPKFDHTFNPDWAVADIDTIPFLKLDPTFKRFQIETLNPDSTISYSYDWPRSADIEVLTAIGLNGFGLLFGDNYNEVASISVELFEKNLESFIDPYELVMAESFFWLDTITTEHWVEYKSLDGEFSVRLPYEPRLLSTKETQTGSGPIVMNNIGIEDIINGIKYQISYADYPKKMILEPDEFFEHYIENTLDKSDASLKSITTIVTDEYEGREVVLALPDDLMVKGRLYIVGNRFYQVYFATTEDKLQSVYADTFFASFKIIRSEQVEWRMVRSKKGSFSVQMPEQPTYEQKIHETPLGEVPVSYYKLDHTQSGINFLITIQEYGEEIVGDDPKNFVEGAIQSTARSLYGKVTDREDVQKNGIEGKEVIIKGREGIFFRCQYYLIGTKLYQVSIFGPKTSIDSEEAKRFFNSFKFSL